MGVPCDYDRIFEVVEGKKYLFHAENEITLPLHTKLTDKEVEYVVGRYCEIVKGYL